MRIVADEAYRLAASAHGFVEAFQFPWIIGEDEDGCRVKADHQGNAG